MLNPEELQEELQTVSDLARRAGARTTLLKISDDLENDLREALTEIGQVSNIVAIFDTNTAKACGESLLATLPRSINVHRRELAADSVCSRASARRIVVPEDTDCVLTIGSGTLTDLGKLVAGANNIPQIACATAASMNGFTSKLAATLDDGVKLTHPAPPPRAVIAAPDVLAAAPAGMNAAGFGDLLSKQISAADWRLAHHLLDAPWDLPVVEQLDHVERFIAGDVDRAIADHQPQALANLLGGLYVTGIAMQAASPGTQASGAEHLFSHYLDMIAGAPDFEHRAAFHGAQVALGSLVAIRAWERLRDVCSKRPPAVPPHLTSTQARAAFLDANFGSLAPTLRQMHERKNWDGAFRQKLVQRLHDGALVAEIRSMLPTFATHHSRLERSGCPTTMAAIGVSASLAAQAIRLAPWVRARYTVLHALEDLGELEDFATDCARELAEP